jgi:hypothetical protein
MAKAAMAEALGFKVSICGEVNAESSLEYQLAKSRKIKGPGER